jgi:hypothetical protein
MTKTRCSNFIDLVVSDSEAFTSLSLVYDTLSLLGFTELAIYVAKSGSFRLSESTMTQVLGNGH